MYERRLRHFAFSLDGSVVVNAVIAWVVKTVFELTAADTYDAHSRSGPSVL